MNGTGQSRVASRGGGTLFQLGSNKPASSSRLGINHSDASDASFLHVAGPLNRNARPPKLPKHNVRVSADAEGGLKFSVPPSIVENDFEVKTSSQEDEDKVQNGLKEESSETEPAVDDGHGTKLATESSSDDAVET